MEGALKLSGDFVRQAMTDAGFVNLQVGGAESIEAFVRLAARREDNAEGGLEPAAAAELAAHTGTQMAGDVNLAMRVLTRVDSARVAALLK